jgi:hypothetical protein
VDAFAKADQTPVGAPLVGRISQTREPGEGHRDFSTVGENDADRIFGEFDARRLG